MSSRRGIFVALEGVDGSGKSTQFNLLSERLKAVGYEVATFDFPRYDQPSSHFVKKYLNGEYGPASEVNPYTASFFYALDRYEASKELSRELEQGKIVLSNRYTGSNMAHQGSKFGDEAEQRGFFIWADSLEYQLLGIPRPDVSIVLRVPAEVSYKLVSQKGRRGYTREVRDQHEADLQHLQKSLAAYDSLCRLFPRDFVAVDCTEGGRLLGVPAINDRIWQLIHPGLTGNLPRNAPKSKTVSVKPHAEVPEPLSLVDSSEPIDDQRIAALALSAVSRLSLRPFIKHRFLVTLTKVSSPTKLVYFTPSGLKGKTLTQYQQFMHRLGQVRSEIWTKLGSSKNPKFLALDAVGALSPMAELVTAKAHGTKSGAKTLAVELNNSSHAELKALSRKLASSRNDPVLAGRAKPALADALPTSYSAAGELAILNSYWPRLEFDLIADDLYTESELGRSELLAGIAEWSYEQKVEALMAAMSPAKQISPNHTENIKYEWDLLLDGPSLDYLLNKAAFRVNNAQSLSQRFGYNMPEIIETAGLEDVFLDCFDRSLELFSTLQAAGFEDEAQYVVLQGHKQRWEGSTDYQQLLKLSHSRSDPSAPSGLRLLVDSLLEAVAQVHPVIARDILTKHATPSGTVSNTAAPKASKTPRKPRVASQRRTRRRPR